jgi:hypothetical protein
MKDINPKTPIGTKLLSRSSRSYAGQPMTAVLVDFRSKERAFGSWRARPYIVDREHVCVRDCPPDCERKPYPMSSRYSSINRDWRIADFSIVGFEGFGYEVTELAQKAAWSIVRACAGFNMDFDWIMACRDAAMGWTKGPDCDS